MHPSVSTFRFPLWGHDRSARRLGVGFLAALQAATERAKYLAVGLPAVAGFEGAAYGKLLLPSPDAPRK